MDNGNTFGPTIASFVGEKLLSRLFANESIDAGINRYSRAKYVQPHGCLTKDV